MHEQPRTTGDLRRAIVHALASGDAGTMQEVMERSDDACRQLSEDLRSVDRRSPQ